MRNYSPWKLIPRIYHKYLLKLMDSFYFYSQLKPTRNKKPRAKHVFNAHFVGSRISLSREQAQAKKGLCGPTKSAEMKQSSSLKKVPAKN